MSAWSDEAVVAEIAARANAWTPPAGQPLGLADGTVGTALLLAELSRHDPELRRAAHARLTDAATTLLPVAGRLGPGLYQGTAGLAFAIRAAVRKPGDYATIRERLDTFLRERLGRLLALEKARMSEGKELVPRERFDAVTGVTGIARYFLDDPAGPQAVRDALRYLTALTEPRVHEGRTLPGWAGPPWPGQEADGDTIDVGLAHGIAGPLALLSLCWSRGIRVPGQDAAIRRAAKWLLSWRQDDEAGPYWPMMVSAADEAAGRRPRHEPHRPSWCYGPPGIARALQLAGLALGETEWPRVAVDAMHAVRRRPEGRAGLDDPGLCHGLAGQAHLTRVIAHDAQDPILAEHAASLTDRLRARFEPASAFGYPTRGRRRLPPAIWDAPTFLEGSAGVALVLHRRGPTPPRWDAALLVN
ncbi:lanthionine synthetase C family protein [Streptomyces johnsoniae]|uniref:Lanthionine synthetase C family protein n=1 Tax=Streptomyces johnsoniae TaxID=3075532 RepID=A0ABU2SEA6_9ACTN|nr:lanthionine synthetase C family protein [Streptomyces sp. DSM 41886]MDT0447138.1 lanthionine synthetase C family protein [Streptomyces sp. DSM 41886]